MVKVIDPDNYKVFRCRSLFNFVLLEIFMIVRVIFYVIFKIDPMDWFNNFGDKFDFHITTVIAYMFLEFILIQYFICMKAINLR